MKILMIDDQKKPFWFMDEGRKTLEGVPVEITLVTTFQEALDKLKDLRWDAWMLDMYLDKQHTGLELLGFYFSLGFYPPKIIYGISFGDNMDLFKKVQELKEKDERWLTTEFIQLKSRF
jgi:response regulator of citrate/malate metabolism